MIPIADTRVGDSIEAKGGQIAPVADGGDGRGKGEKPPPGQPTPYVKTPPTGGEKSDADPDPNDPNDPIDGDSDNDSDPDDGDPRDGEKADGDDSRDPPTEDHECGGGDLIREIIRDAIEQGTVNPPLSPGEYTKLWDTAATAYATFVTGTMGGRTNDAIVGRIIKDVMTPPKVPWERLLRRSLRGMLSKIAAQGSPTYQRFSRRTYALHGSESAYIEPAKKGSPGVDVAVIVDTSGSVGARALGIALKETSALIASRDVGRVLFIAADWIATEAQEIPAANMTNPREAKKKILPFFKGGRGSDKMVENALLEVTKGNKRRVREGLKPIENVVVFTDGYVNWPTKAQARGINFIVCLLPSAICRQCGVEGCRIEVYEGKKVPNEVYDKTVKNAPYATIIRAEE
jgi:hypothetical protein